MGKPFKMMLKDGVWIPHKPTGNNPPYNPGPEPPTHNLLETIEIHKRPTTPPDKDSRYLKVVNTGKCYEIEKAKHFFMLEHQGEWIPCKGNSDNSSYKIIPCPTPESPIEDTVKIYEGSQWVNVGGRWYLIG